MTVPGRGDRDVDGEDGIADRHRAAGEQIDPRRDDGARGARRAPSRVVAHQGSGFRLVLQDLIDGDRDVRRELGRHGDEVVVALVVQLRRI